MKKYEHVISSPRKMAELFEKIIIEARKGNKVHNKNITNNTLKNDAEGRSNSEEEAALGLFLERSSQDAVPARYGSPLLSPLSFSLSFRLPLLHTVSHLLTCKSISKVALLLVFFVLTATLNLEQAIFWTFYHIITVPHIYDKVMQELNEVDEIKYYNYYGFYFMY